MASNGSFSAFEEGFPVWYFRGYQVDHLNENGDPVFRDNDGNGSINHLVWSFGRGRSPDILSVSEI